MAFVVIAGITVPIALDGITEQEPDEGGEDTRAFAGNLRSTSRWTRRRWKLTTKPWPVASGEALIAAVANAAHVTCSGDGLGDGVTNFTCRVKMRETGYVKVKGGHRRTYNIELIQV
jgi:hypothetical protein